MGGRGQVIYQGRNTEAKASEALKMWDGGARRGGVCGTGNE